MVVRPTGSRRCCGTRRTASVSRNDSCIGRSNVDLSGGEKKRNETLQLAVLAPRIAILDELDSGLDIDALRDCARRVEAMSNEPNGDGEPLGVLAITHYNRLLPELEARPRAHPRQGPDRRPRWSRSWPSSSRPTGMPRSPASRPTRRATPGSLDDLFAF